MIGGADPRVGGGTLLPRRRMRYGMGDDPRVGGGTPDNERVKLTATDDPRVGGGTWALAVLVSGSSR